MKNIEYKTLIQIYMDEFNIQHMTAHPDIKLKDRQNYLKSQEVSQTNATVNKTYQYKITASPRTFQIDIFYGRNQKHLFLCYYL
jgi:hypothetical protein